MKVISVRLDDALHAQVEMVARLNGTNVTDEIRIALDNHVKAAKATPDVTARAAAAMAELEQEYQARKAALAGLVD